MPQLEAVGAGLDGEAAARRVERRNAAWDGPGQAKAHLAEVGARFPASPAITFLTGTYGQLVGAHAEALQSYDRTLALQPAHDEALLGRTICLTILARPQEAIDAATQLIARGAGNLAEAYYWRAWNHHTLARLAEARADITAARDLMKRHLMSTTVSCRSRGAALDLS